ncbi:MAG: BadF/BadG/BcrA/BcrD ATPase family protein [Erysipelotrichaceae bacterium]|nr:BadF/BadG/BcrA/BcrD ATPase family protein [Erysipelotrichaceae bacterium]
MMAKHAYYLLGIDGGGTKTRFKLTGNAGNTVRETVLGPSNPNDIGVERTIETLRSGIRTVLDEIPAETVYAYAGIAGAASGRNRDAVCACMQEFGFAGSDAGGDVENILSAGLNGHDGMILILGTGICAFSVKDGIRYRTGGWGYLLDKGGSGYNYGCDVLNAYYSAIDHTGSDTLLSDLVERKTDMNSSQLLTKIYELGKPYIASFAPLAFEAAELGDRTARGIISGNIQATVRIIETGLRPFAGKPVPVVLSGGLTENRKLIGMIREQLPAETGEMVRILSVPPVDGALLNAEKLVHDRLKNK